MQPGTFPGQWKKANIVAIHEKGDKQLVNIWNIYAIISDPIILKDMFKHFKDIYIVWF